MKSILFIILNLALSNNLYSDVIYKSYGKNGNPVYSDREPNSKYEIVKKGGIKSNPKTEEENIEAIPTVRSMESIRTITNTAQQDVNTIYEELYKSNQDINGKVVITFSINKEGKVISCAEDESGMSIASFDGKICEKINTINYGEVEKSEATKVKYTYQFQPEK